MKEKNGFELVRQADIPELRTNARLYRHQKTGARLLSLENDDENKVFGINFRTPPSDSTGLPHIMEHAVLCGSQRFPVREPFVELLKGSLKTFVNAFTFPDKTGYPVASQNVQDFYNLIDVYMDAVLHPLIPPHTLEQEGWHYELDSLEGELQFKGVVFNEMKGAYSSPDGLMARYSQELLFPGHVYGFSSGGDPQVIPDLTYEQFKSFHETYYHPSNAYIFFYGDDDPQERLVRMDTYLKEYDARPVDSSIPLMPRMKQPQRFIRPYDVGQDAGEKKHMLTVNWMLGESTDAETALGMNILAHILIGTPASPLRKALIDSGLGEDLAGVGLETDLRQGYFSTGLKGMAGQDADQVESLLLDTLAQLAQDGIDPETVAASLNTIEFRMRENNTGAFPRGILLMVRALNTWLYDGNPFAPLAFEAPLEGIKQRLNNGERYFEDLIQRFLLDNTHRISLILEPDAQLNQRLEAEERQRLDAVRATLDQAELAALVENTRLLKLRQETPDSPEALATIPSLKLSDLEPLVKTIPIEESAAYGTRLFTHDLFTNGIVYLDLGMDLGQLPQELLPYVTLFGRALTELGTEKEDFVRLSQRIGRTTGGIRSAPLATTIRQTGEAVTWLFLRGKATTSQAADLLAILTDVLLSVKLDNRERFRQIVLEEKADMEAMLVPAGHQVVNTRLRSLFNTADWVSEQMGGVSYLFFLRKLSEQIESDWQGVLGNLQKMRTLLVNRSRMIANITLDDQSAQIFRPQLERFLAQLPSAETQSPAWHPQEASSTQGLIIPAQVNYVGKGGNLYQLGYQLDGSIQVINNYMRTTWLWEHVRVQGGAYGAFCPFDPRSGVFTYLSYRDPNLVETLDVYDRTSQFLRELELSQEELTKSIIGAIGAMDAYQLPDAKGFTSMLRHLTGESDQERQKLREEIMGTSQQDFKAFAGVLEELAKTGKVVVLGSHEDIEAANQERGDWLEITKVL